MATVRELRHLLFNIDSQSMTVDELRHLLFNIEDQEGPARDAINLINALGL